jgi:hypothetical protein
MRMRWAQHVIYMEGRGFFFFGWKAQREETTVKT